MSSDPLKKRKSKVLRGEGAVPEIKRGRVEGDQQVSTYGRLKPDLLDQLSSGWRYSKLIKIYSLHLLFANAMKTEDYNSS